MLSEPQKLYQSIEDFRDQLFQSLDKFQGAQLSFKPNSKEWSILEVIHHLVLAEQSTLSVVEKQKGSGKPLKRAGIGSSIRSKMLNFLLRLPLKVKVPKGAEMICPSSEVNFSELKTNWQELRERWKIFLESLSESELKEVLFIHPVGGPFNIIQTLKFMAEHLEHHGKQIYRIQNATDFPKEETKE